MNGNARNFQSGNIFLTYRHKFLLQKEIQLHVRNYSKIIKGNVIHNDGNIIIILERINQLTR